MDFLVEIAGCYVLHIIKDKTVSLWIRILFGSMVLIGYVLFVLGSGLMAWVLRKESLMNSIFLFLIFLFLIGSGISFCKKCWKEKDIGNKQRC